MVLLLGKTRFKNFNSKTKTKVSALWLFLQLERRQDSHHRWHRHHLRHRRFQKSPDLCGQVGADGSLESVTNSKYSSPLITYLSQNLCADVEY